jgi:LacI family gluconate utilization system Gnt-I transcriptional repressor
MANLLDGGFIDVAVFCSSDTLAQGALIEIQSRDLSIPDQIAMVGFGDQPLAAHTVPSLTTIKFDRALIGRKATGALLSRINDELILQKVIDVGFQLIERQTT